MEPQSHHLSSIKSRQLLSPIDTKRHAVEAFKSLNYRVISAGNSYNDTSMLAASDAGILFRAPANVVAEFPQFPTATEYEELKERFLAASDRTLSR